MIIGGTAAAIAGKDFIVLGSTKGATMYDMFMISRKAGKRIFKMYDRILVGYTGLYADFQYIHSILENFLKKERLAYNINPSVKRVSRILSAILYSDRFRFPNYIEAIVGGFDPDGSGPYLYIVGPVGSVIDDLYAAAGEGFEIALGIIEAQYREDLTVEEAKKIVESALRTAAARNLMNEPTGEPEIEVIEKH